jgi:hypothetical protein
VVFKLDVGLEDNQCFSAKAPTLNDITPALTTAWLPITGGKTELHAEIALDDRLATYATVKLRRNTHYYKLTTECLTPTRIPFIEDKEIAIAESLAADPDDEYDMPKYCDIDQETQWTGY